MGDPTRPVALHVGDGASLLRAAAETVTGELVVQPLDADAAVSERATETDVVCVVVGAATPDATTHALVATLRTAHPDLPVLVVAGDRETAAAAVEAGATDTFVRAADDPDAALLARRLESVLGRTGAEATAASRADPWAADHGRRSHGEERSPEDAVVRAAADGAAGSADGTVRSDRVDFLRTLYEVAGDRDLDHEERIRRLLSLGRAELGLAWGFLTDIELPAGTDADDGEGTQTVTEVVGEESAITPGDSCPLSEAYCKRTIRTDGLLAMADALTDGMAGDPAYERFGLDAYIGAKVFVGDALHGTVCFAAREPREPFTAFERTAVHLLSELVGRELDERRQTTALHRYGTILEALGDPAYTADTDGRLTFVNDAFVAHTGSDREALLGEHVSAVLPAPEFERWRTAVDDLRASAAEGGADADGESDGDTIRWEMPRATADGDRMPTENHIALVRDDDRTVQGTATVIRDISERVEQRRALERGHDRLAAAFDAAPYPFARVRFEGAEPVIERINEAFAATFGCERGSVAGDPLSSHARPVDGVDTEPDGWTLDEGAIEREVARRTAAGARREFLLRTAVLDRDDDGVTEGLAAYVDITERKRQAEQLEQLRRNVTEVVWMTDPRKESMDFISEAYEDTWGRTTESLYENPTSFVDAIHPADRERVREALAEQQENPDDYEETYRVVQPDGTIRWVRDRSSGVYRNGELVRLVGVARDITAVKRREQELSTFRNAVENAAHPISWLAPDGTIEYVNPAFEAQTGYDATEAVGRPVSMLRAGVHDEERYERMWDALTSGETWEAETVRRRKDGERYIAKRTVSPVTDDGELVRVVAVASDVTDRHRREQQLSVLQRVLRHDLRNSLNEILLAAEGIERAGGAPEEQVAAIKGSVEETLSLSRSIKRMQELFEQEDAELKRVVDLTELVAEQLSTLRTERPEVTVSTDLPETAPVVINGLVGRAIRNVLQNAVEHNDAPTPAIEVSVRYRPETDETALRIADNGPGIPEATVSVLDADAEEPLQHLDGFGLWLVQWVLSLSGGGLEFETGVGVAGGADTGGATTTGTDPDEDRGTAVTLVLPADDPPSHR